MGSRFQGAGGVDAAQDVCVGVGSVGFCDVGEGVGVAENVDGLFELGEVVEAEEDSRGASVAGYGDALVVVFDTIDDLTEVLADGAERLIAHVHNRGRTK